MIAPSERLSVINQRLLDHYGRIENGMVRWRVVWSTDQFEKRQVDAVGAIFLARPEVREMPKYPLAQDFFILERVIPTHNNPELVEPWSYEPMWTFIDKDGNPLPPKWEAIEFIIKRIHEQMAEAGHGPKYKRAEIDEDTPEAKEERVRNIYKALYGDETDVGNSLAVGEGVGFTTSKVIH